MESAPTICQLMQLKPMQTGRRGAVPYKISIYNKKHPRKISGVLLFLVSVENGVFLVDEGHNSVFEVVGVHQLHAVFHFLSVCSLEAKCLLNTELLFKTANCKGCCL